MDHFEIRQGAKTVLRMLTRGVKHFLTFERRFLRISIANSVLSEEQAFREVDPPALRPIMMRPPVAPGGRVSAE